MTIQAALAMRPVMLPVHPANLVGYVHSLAVLVPAPYSEYFTSRGFLRCPARVLKFPFSEVPVLLQVARLSSERSIHASHE